MSEQGNLVTDELVAVVRGMVTGDQGPYRELEARYRGTGTMQVERGLDLLWKAAFEVFLHHRLGPEPTRAEMIAHVADFRRGIPDTEDPGAVVPEMIVRGFYGDAEALQSLSPDQLAHIGAMLMHLVVITGPTAEELDALLAQAQERAEQLAVYQQAMDAGGAGNVEQPDISR